MTYIKSVHVDELRDAGGNITQEGTTVNAEKLNNMEEGIEDVDLRVSGLEESSDALVTKTTADITLYVRTDGSDANDGSANDATHALKTIQAAIDKIPQIVNHPCTIYVAPGTYAEDVSIKGFNGGKDRIAIYGDSVVSTSRTVNSFDVRSSSIFIYIRGFNVVTTTTNALYVLGCINAHFDFFNITAAAAQIGIYLSRSMARVTSCTISNRSVGIYSAQASTASISSVSGTGNGIGINTTDGGSAFISSSTVTGSIAQQADGGSIIINSDGTIGGLIRGQQVLITARSLFVRTDGNDSNDGLSNTAGGAFKTIQAAINSLPKRLDAVATINVASGTYAENVSLYGFCGHSSISIVGDAIVSTSRSVIRFSVVACTAAVVISGFNVTNTSDYGALVQRSIDVTFSKMNMVASALAYSGILAYYSTITVWDSTISNKLYAVAASERSHVYVIGISGSGNINATFATAGGIMCVHGSTITATTTNLQDTAGVTFGADTPMIRNNAGIFEFWNGAAWIPLQYTRQGSGLPGTSGTLSVTMDGCIKPITPTGACTFTASGGVAGQRCTFQVITSGVTSYVLTWGTGFKATGTLSTGTVTAKTFCISFIFDGATWLETGRTVAM